MRNAFSCETEMRQRLSAFILISDRFSMGDYCAQFEQEFARWQGRAHAILFNSGGSANLALIQALQNLSILKRGNKVGFSALTWSTNVMPIIQLWMEPIPVDCAPSTLNSMSADLEYCLHHSRLDAFFITNALGFSGDLEWIRSICQKHNIVLLEDNCESLGTELPDGRTGNFGLASTFSFFVGHHMSTIEGGMVCTDNQDLAEMLKVVRANGWDRNLTAEQQRKWRNTHGIKNEFDAAYTFYDLGFNFRPTEITGFLGCAQLPHLDKNIYKRRLNYAQWEAVTKKNDDLIPVEYPHIDAPSPFALPVICRSTEIREKYLLKFRHANVEVRPMLAGNMQNQPFYRKYGLINPNLLGVKYLHNCSFYCGNYPELTEEELQIMCHCIERT